MSLEFVYAVNTLAKKATMELHLAPPVAGTFSLAGGVVTMGARPDDIDIPPDLVRENIENIDLWIALVERTKAPRTLDWLQCREELELDEDIAKVEWKLVAANVCLLEAQKVGSDLRLYAAPEYTFSWKMFLAWVECLRRISKYYAERL